jgi:hypothetical protein
MPYTETWEEIRQPYLALHNQEIQQSVCGAAPYLWAFRTDSRSFE